MEKSSTAGKWIARTKLRTFIRSSELPGSDQARRSALSKAAKRGDIVKVRRGLYYKGVKTRYGMTRPDADEIVHAVLGDRGVGPAGYSAARALGLTAQVPRKTHVAVTGPLPINIPDISMHKRNNLLRHNLNRTEIAILEVLRAPDVFSDSGWPGVVSAVDELASKGAVRLSKLSEAATKEGPVSVRENASKLSASLAERTIP